VSVVPASVPSEICPRASRFAHSLTSLKKSFSTLLFSQREQADSSPAIFCQHLSVPTDSKSHTNHAVLWLTWYLSLIARTGLPGPTTPKRPIINAMTYWLFWGKRPCVNSPNHLLHCVTRVCVCVLTAGETLLKAEPKVATRLHFIPPTLPTR
jgi:hypothetical protein